MHKLISFFTSAFAALFLVLAAAPGEAAVASRGHAVRADAGALESCTWDKPGQNPYMGDVVAAVDRYADIAPDVRERLRARMIRREYDDIVTIKRDSITGKGRYGSTIRDMHFGARQLCHSVSRAGWSPAMQERGLVYCDSGQCILVPTICRNVSRISRAEVADEKAFGALPPVAAVPVPPPAPDSFVALSKDTPPVPVAGAPASSEAPSGPFAGGGGGSGGGDGFPGGGGGGGNGGGFPGGPIAGPPGGGTGAFPPGPPVIPVAPVPEPETWALMLAGLAACGALRARKKHAATSR